MKRYYKIKNKNITKLKSYLDTKPNTNKNEQSTRHTPSSNSK